MDSLFIATTKDNPFARQMAENAKAVDQLIEKLKGASPELKSVAFGMQAAENASKTFELQIQNQFQTIDLRSQEQRFRDPTKKDAQAGLDLLKANFNRESNSTNPDVLLNIQERQKDIDQQDARRKQDVIDQKLDIAAKAKTDDQKAIADKAVTSFASGLNPDDLTRQERSRVADAFERSAVRNERRQEDALQIYKDILKSSQNIEGWQKKQTEAAKSGNKLEVTVKDSDGRVDKATTPTPEDTKVHYEFGGFSMVGGSNQ
jgi:hypothetical protein